MTHLFIHRSSQNFTIRHTTELLDYTETHNGSTQNLSLPTTVCFGLSDWHNGYDKATLKTTTLEASGPHSLHMHSSTIFFTLQNLSNWIYNCQNVKHFVTYLIKTLQRKTTFPYFTLRTKRAKELTFDFRLEVLSGETTHNGWHIKLYQLHIHRELDNHTHSVA